MRISPEEFIVPSKSNKNLERITVAIIGSNPPDGMKSKPSVSVKYLDEKYTLLDAQVNSVLSAFPNADILYIAGHDINRIVYYRPPNLRIVENTNYRSCGETEDIRLAINCSITDKLILMKNNVLFNSQIFRLLKIDRSSLLTGEKVKEKDILGAIHHNSKLENISFGNGDSFYNVGCFFGKELQLLKKFCNNSHNRNMFMFEAVNYLISRGGYVKTVSTSDKVKVL